MHRHLLPAALALSALAPSALAQTPSGDAVRGRPLFENTPTASGKAGITANCVSCHGSVESRRSTISANSGGAADPYADITFDMAMTRFALALQNQAAMRMFQALDAQQVWDIAAYLADTPKTNPPSETQITLTTAINTSTPARAVTLTHARATTDNLVVSSVALVGAGAGSFVLGNRLGCEGVTLTPGQSCSVNVTYAPTTNSASDAELVLTMKQGAGTNPNFERVLPFRGTVSGGSSPSDGGGGALGLGWLAALGVAVLGLSRRRA